LVDLSPTRFKANNGLLDLDLDQTTLKQAWLELTTSLNLVGAERKIDRLGDSLRLSRMRDIA
jgi:hypothetical protein